MLTKHTYALAFLSTLCLINGDWGTKDVSEERGRWQRQPINITGTLTTHNCGTDACDSYAVSNISLDRHIKQIKFFALPKAALFTVSSEKPSIRIISKEPAKYLDTTNIDLVEIKKLEVPFPDITWIYEENPGKGRKLEFVQIDITLADGTKNGYLTPSRTMLYCDRETHGAGPQEKDVPMAAIKELTIAGCSKKDDEEVKPRAACMLAQPNTEKSVQTTPTVEIKHAEKTATTKPIVEPASATTAPKQAAPAA